MNEYVTPSMKHKLDVMVSHLGTNDLGTKKTPADIVEEIVNLADRLKTPENEIIISGLIMRNDSLSDKGKHII